MACVTGPSDEDIQRLAKNLREQELFFRAQPRWWRLRRARRTRAHMVTARRREQRLSLRRGLQPGGLPRMRGCEISRDPVMLKL